MTFGIKRLPLSKDEFNLDEDGWIDVRTRMTVRASLMVQANSNGDQIAGTQALLQAYVTGWSIKAGGEELKFSEATLLDLPVEILEPLQREIESAPLVRVPMPSP